MSNKENSNADSEAEKNKSCFECNLSLSKSRHLINIEQDETDDRCESDAIDAIKTAKVWHSECFKCNICNQLLDKERSCFLYRNKIVCREDYAIIRTNLSSCKRCQYPLSASDWVMKVGHSFAYHLTCFTCDICSRELKTGEKFIIEQREKSSEIVSSDANMQPAVAIKLEHLLMCERHFKPTKRVNQINANCGIPDQAKPKTSSANADQLPNEINQYDPSVANRDNQVYEQNMLDNQPNKINNKDSTGLRSFHVKLFHDQHSMNGPNNQHDQNHSSTPNYLTHQTNDDSSFNLHQLSSSSNIKQINLINDLESHDDLDEHADSSSHSSESSEFSNSHKQNHQLLSCATSSGGSHHHHHSSSSLSNKSKRVRTTFTEEQLAILQTHFQSDSNPDGQDLERIATITGLSKRVTQVWFQNSRARQKKYMIKRKPNSMALGLGSSSMNMENQGNNSNNATTMHHDATAPGSSNSNNQLQNSFDNSMGPSSYNNLHHHHHDSEQIHNQQKHANLMSRNMQNYVDESICKWSPTSSDGDEAAGGASSVEDEADFHVKSRCNTSSVETQPNTLTNSESRDYAN